jgi:hypothetical protein
MPGITDTVTPGAVMSTRNRLMPWYFPAPGVVRAAHSPRSTKRVLRLNTFVPVIR